METGTLTVGNIGFQEIADIYFENLVALNPGNPLTGVSVSKFESDPNDMPRFFNGQAGRFMASQIIVRMADGNTFYWNSKDLTEKIDKLKDPYILFYGSGIFLLGVVVQIMSKWKKAKADLLNAK